LPPLFFGSPLGCLRTPHVGLSEALELCLLLRDKPERSEDGSPLAQPSLQGGRRKPRAQAILAALVLMAGERKRNAAFAIADLLSRRGLDRSCETLVAWALPS
jgi:hypothetical protein